MNPVAALVDRYAPLIKPYDRAAHQAFNAQLDDLRRQESQAAVRSHDEQRDDIADGHAYQHLDERSASQRDYDAAAEEYSHRGIGPW